MDVFNDLENERKFDSIARGAWLVTGLGLITSLGITAFIVWVVVKILQFVGII